jgi:hypothetical protein
METTFDMCDLKNLPGLKEKQQQITSVNGKMNAVRNLLSQMKPAIMADDEYQQEVEFAKPENFLKREDYFFSCEREGKGEDKDFSIVEDFFLQNRKEKNKRRLIKRDEEQEEQEQENDEKIEFHEIDQKMNKTAAMETLMGICGRSLIAELVHCRISEYVVRAENPWMGIGQMEQIEPGLFSTPAGPNPPLVKFDLSSRPEADATPWKLREEK